MLGLGPCPPAAATRPSGPWKAAGTTGGVTDAFHATKFLVFRDADVDAVFASVSGG
jgi:hypothetical protein